MTNPDSTPTPEQSAATFAEATGSEATQHIALASGMEKPNGERVPCACVHYDATDCARIRDGFDSDDPRYEGYRRKCGCLCHDHEDEDDGWEQY